MQLLSPGTTPVCGSHRAHAGNRIATQPANYFVHILEQPLDLALVIEADQVGARDFMQFAAICAGMEKLE